MIFINYTNETNNFSLMKNYVSFRFFINSSKLFNKIIEIQYLVQNFPKQIYNKLNISNINILFLFFHAGQERLQQIIKSFETLES
jgi:hypothetical protein